MIVIANKISSASQNCSASTKILEVWALRKSFYAWIDTWLGSTNGTLKPCKLSCFLAFVLLFGQLSTKSFSLIFTNFTPGQGIFPGVFWE
jgi:hypothetical protein